MCELGEHDTIWLAWAQIWHREAEDEVRLATISGIGKAKPGCPGTRQVCRLPPGTGEAAAHGLSAEGSLAKGCNLCTCSLGTGEAAAAWNPGSR